MEVKKDGRTDSATEFGVEEALSKTPAAGVRAARNMEELWLSLGQGFPQRGSHVDTAGESRDGPGEGGAFLICGEEAPVIPWTLGEPLEELADSRRDPTRAFRGGAGEEERAHESSEFDSASRRGSNDCGDG